MDLIISNALSKYMNVFVKNWTSSALSLSILRGEGKLSNLQLKESVIQEIIDAPMLKVTGGRINELLVKLPQLTRLKSDPIQIKIDKFELELEEPIDAIQIGTVFRDFMSGMSKKSKTSKYGFGDKVIDGLTIHINSIIVSIKPLGWFPSKDIGPWTPPILKISVSNFVLETTNRLWRVVSLKEALPQFNRNLKSFFVHRRGQIGNIKVELYHKQIDSEEIYVYPDWMPTQLILVDKIHAQLRITQRKTMLGGILLGMHCELSIEQCNVKWNQNHLGGLIHWLSAMAHAASRPNLIEPYYEMKKELLKKAPSQLSSSMSAKPSSSSRSSALKYVNSENRNDTEEDSSIFGDSYSESEVSFDDESLKDWEVVGNIENRDFDITYPRVVVNCHLDELHVQVHDLKGEGQKEFLCEILGTSISLLRPDDAPSERHLQMKVAFIQVCERILKELNSNNTLSEIEINRLLAAEEFSTLFGPRYKVVDDEMNYTIPIPLWPEFLSNNRYFPEQKVMSSSPFKPLESKKRIFFLDGKEMVRLKFVLTPESYIFEQRLNPIQFMLNMPKLMTLFDLLFESVPDMDMIPPSKIEVPHTTKKDEQLKNTSNPPSPSMQSRSSTTLDDTDTFDSEEDMEKSVTFLIELRDPCILIPSNSKTGEYDDVSELMRWSTKEIIISSDSQLRKQKWTEDPDSLYSAVVFPGAADDITKNAHAMFECLPRKLKFQITRFCMELLPSMSSPGKPFMDPVSLDVYLGLNDPSLSAFHQTLPKLLIMSKVPELHLKLNQNQAILLLELWKTYTDDPPQLTKLFVEHTKSVVSTGRRVHSSKRNITTEGKSGLIPTFSIVNLEKILITLSSSEKDSVSMIDALSYSSGSELCEISITGTEIAVETLSESQQLLVKNRIKSVTVLSPPSSQQASAISVATAGYPSNYIFSNKPDLGKNVKWVFQARLEYPLHPILQKLSNRKTDVDKESIQYNINPYIKTIVNGLHVGLNAQSSYQILRFLESKDNIFDSSPLDIMNVTVKRTVSVVKEKYLQKKSKDIKKEITESGEIPTLHEPIDTIGSEPASEITLDTDAEPEIIDRVNNTDSSTEIIKTPSEEDLEKVRDRIQIEHVSSKSNISDLNKAEDNSVDQLTTIENQNSENQSIKNSEIMSRNHDDKETNDIEERPEFNDESISEMRKLTAVGKKLKSTFQARPKIINPMIMDCDFTECELSILEDSNVSSAVTISFEKVVVSHLPKDPKTLVEEHFGRCFSIYSHEFHLVMDSKLIQFHTLVPQIGDEENIDKFSESNNDIRVLSHALGDPFSLRFTFTGDYSKKITEREAHISLTPSTDSISIHMSPTLISTTSNIIKQQFSSLKEFQHLLKLLKKPSYDMSFNFQRLRSQISKSQLTLTRALVCQSSLQNAFSEINSELESREEALQSMIGDKMRLTQMLAESQAYEIQNGVKEEVKEDVILMESVCAAQKNLTGEWKKVYAYLLNNELFCLSQKVINIREIFNVKLRMFNISIDRDTILQKRRSPIVKSSKQAHDIIDIAHGVDVISIFTTNEKHMLDWYRVMEICIEDDKIQKEIEERKKSTHAIEIQTEESSFDDTNLEKNTKNQVYIKELKDLRLQLESMKETMKIAAKDEVILRERLSELSRYVDAVEKEKKLKKIQIRNRIAIEAERIKQLEAQQEINKRLQTECNRRQKHIDLVKKKYDELNEKKKRVEEEKQLLQENFKMHLMHTDKEMKHLRDESSRLKYQLSSLKGNSDDSKIKTLKDTFETIIRNLENELAEKNNLINSLKEENIQLKSSRSEIPSQPSTIVDDSLSPLSPPPPGVNDLFTLSENEANKLLTVKPTRDSRALLLNTSPRNIQEVNSLDFTAASPILQDVSPSCSSPSNKGVQSNNQPPGIAKPPSRPSHTRNRSLFSNLKAGIKEKSKQAIQRLDAKVSEAVAMIEDDMKRKTESRQLPRPINTRLPPPPKINKRKSPTTNSSHDSQEIEFTRAVPSNQTSNLESSQVQNGMDVLIEKLPINILQLDAEENKHENNVAYFNSESQVQVQVSTFSHSQTMKVEENKIGYELFDPFDTYDTNSTQAYIEKIPHENSVTPTVSTELSPMTFLEPNKKASNWILDEQIPKEGIDSTMEEDSNHEAEPNDLQKKLSEVHPSDDLHSNTDTENTGNEEKLENDTRE